MVNHAPDAYDSFVDDGTPGQSSRIRIGVRGGLVSAAATAGAVIGFGIRNGDWSGPFSGLAYEVMTNLGAEPPFRMPVLVGLLSHAAWMIVWGLVYAVLSSRRTIGTSIVLSVVVSVAAAWLAADLIPAAFGAVRFAQLPGVQVVLCVALTALGMMSSRTMEQRD